jgi:Tfp pilus assembly protein PilV
MKTRSHTGQRGFTLLEALVTMLVTAFGLLGLLNMQLTLSHNADVAKQRGEATRLAQQSIEGLRSFTAIDTTVGHFAWQDLAGGSDQIDTNTQFTRQVTLGGVVTDPMRRASVVVSWVDRAGITNQVSLDTVISKTDPTDVGALGFPLPQNTTLKRPKNRSMNIPVPALDLGNGSSVYQMSSNFAVVFSNDSGYVVQRCDHTVTSEEDLETGCETYDAHILAGYISKTMSSFPASLGVTSAGLSGYDTSRSIECSFNDAIDQNTGVAMSGYKYYLCIVPVTTDGTWSGTMRLAGMASGTNYLVCRMQFAAAAGLTANARNVQPYSQVNDSLDNQNYIITTSGSCPTQSGLVTTLHQECRSSNPSRTTDCPAS